MAILQNVEGVDDGGQDGHSYRQPQRTEVGESSVHFDRREHGISTRPATRGGARIPRSPHALPVPPRRQTILQAPSPSKRPRTERSDSGRLENDRIARLENRIDQLITTVGVFVQRQEGGQQTINISTPSQPDARNAQADASPRSSQILAGGRRNAHIREEIRTPGNFLRAHRRVERQSGSSREGIARNLQISISPTHVDEDPRPSAGASHHDLRFSLLNRRLNRMTEQRNVGRGAGNDLAPVGEQNTRVEVELRRLQDQVDQLRANQSGLPPPLQAGWASSPFSEDIQSAELPRNFKMPAMERYDGKSDPIDYLGLFRAWMDFEGVSDNAMCRVFSLTLCGSARTWFSRLQPGSVRNFEQLGGLFITQFSSVKTLKKPALHLLSVVQREDESLKDYIRRFNEALLTVEEYTDDGAKQAFISGLRCDDFILSVGRKPPRTFPEILSRAQKFVNGEDLLNARRRSNKLGQASRGDQRRNFRSDKNVEVANERKNDRPRESRGKFNNYTRLNTTRENLLMQVETQNILKRPEPTRVPAHKRNTRKYCRYHREFGHDTND